MSQDPPRLGEDGASELTRALQALRSEHDDRARVARVGARLSATLDMPPPRTSWLRALVTRHAKWLLLGGGAGLVGMWLVRTPAPSDRVAQPAAPIAVPSEPAAQPRVAQPATEPDEAAPVELPARQVEPPARAPRSAGSRAPRRARTHTLETAAPEEVQTAPATVASTSTVEPNGPPPPAAAVEQAAPPSGRADAPPASPRASSEFELLEEARRALAPAPRAALTLLEVHERRYPNGMLAPEREVLAIEALRALGRDADAERRLGVFRARHPQSLHLRRLERGAR